jgi:hypothetical protein
VHEIRTDIDLTSKQELVWQLLTTFQLYQHWNPLFRTGNGTLTIGSPLALEVELPGIPKFSVKAAIETIEPQSRFAWRYHMGSRAIFAWEYAINVETLDDQRLRFSQHSRFRGLLAPIYALALKKPLLEGCQALNAAVKRWGERGNITCMKC